MIAWLLLVGCRQGLTADVAVPRTVVEDYDALIHKVVTEDGYVDYDALEADRGPLDAYVAHIAKEKAWPERIGRRWQARWLNAYNALVLFNVLEHDRPDSVLDVSGWIPKAGSGFFFETAFLVRGEWLSLSEIEHERVRQLDLDLRDHAALNCASMSCPPLRAELYGEGGENLRGQLDDQMQRWVADDERGLYFEGEEVVFNPIFDWFARDFEFFSAGLDPCAVAAQYAKGDRRQRLQDLSSRGCPRRFFEYDWSLNDAARRRTEP